MKITANQLTVGRIVLACLVPVFLLVDHSFISRFLAFWTFLVAGLTDIWDGLIARSEGQVTALGKILDPIADKMLNLGTMISFVALGLYSFWFLVLIIIREVVVTGMRFHYIAKGKVLPAESAGKIKTLLQIVSIFFTYIYLLERDYARVSFSFWSDFISHIFVFNSYSMIIAANLVTLYSGIVFFVSLTRKTSDSRR
ncbi:MAG: CDP-diacylglycerol--glycerol-3-phosphate 3-phosphatidyltransferase [Candidatus Omnitrophica bacterium]|nr:CDP-diacylglycerol--glycerol-3-phosphate 3-phosphatidyltransferase [Candidatus Omnitrophota bacterium]